MLISLQNNIAIVGATLGGGGTGDLPVLDDDVLIVPAATAMDFVGSGVTVTDVSGTATVEITGFGVGDVVAPNPPLVDNAVVLGDGTTNVKTDANITYEPTSQELSVQNILATNFNGVPIDVDLSNHVNDVDNPHVVTPAQVGLGDVDNTSDLDKPISTDTQTALDLKLNLSGGIISGTLAVDGNLSSEDLQTPFGGFGGLQNILGASEDFNNTNFWTNSLGNVVVISNNAVAPNGKLDADTIVWTTAGLGLRQTSTETVDGQTYNFSMWIRHVSGNNSFRVDLHDGPLLFFAADSDWRRYSQTIVAGTSGMFLDFTVAGTVGTFEIWGAQLSDGAKLLPYSRTSTELCPPTYGLSSDGMLRGAVSGGSAAHPLELTTVGTNGAAVTMLVGDIEPEGNVFATPGSIYYYINGVDSRTYQLESAIDGAIGWAVNSGSVDGPTSSVDNAVVIWDETSGSQIKSQNLLTLTSQSAHSVLQLNSESNTAGGAYYQLGDSLGNYQFGIFLEENGASRNLSMSFDGNTEAQIRNSGGNLALQAQSGNKTIIRQTSNDTNPPLSIATTGNNGADIQFFSTVRDPIGNITGEPGDIVCRGNPSDPSMFIHEGTTSDNTNWARVLTSSTPNQDSVISSSTPPSDTTKIWWNPTISMMYAYFGAPVNEWLGTTEQTLRFTSNNAVSDGEYLKIGDVPGNPPGTPVAAGTGINLPTPVRLISCSFSSTMVSPGDAELQFAVDGIDTNLIVIDYLNGILSLGSGSDEAINANQLLTVRKTTSTEPIADLVFVVTYRVRNLV